MPVIKMIVTDLAKKLDLNEYRYGWILKRSIHMRSGETVQEWTFNLDARTTPYSLKYGKDRLRMIMRVKSDNLEDVQKCFIERTHYDDGKTQKILSTVSVTDGDDVFWRTVEREQQAFYDQHMSNMEAKRARESGHRTYNGERRGSDDTVIYQAPATTRADPGSLINRNRRHF